MQRNDAIKILGKIGKAFPNMGKIPDDTLNLWAEILQDEDAGQVQKAATRIMRETETIFPGTNLGAMLRNRANPLCTSATVEAHLCRAIEMLAVPNGKPYDYLREISPRLLSMAEQAGAFDRSVSAADMPFRVRDIAKRFIEERENTNRGFMPPDMIGPERQLSAPSGALTEEQRSLGIAKIRQIRERLEAPRDQAEKTQP